ncbi:MAG TPA: hypothetical protein VK747_19725 [Blastocatellia bacterium]|nr:hypothetical protein [Blastocatellia bacterium]
MAAIKGIKERVHLPLYDSIFVGPGKQLRDIATSSVFKFFVNVHGKTKLETNMQSASLLPHWNTFEARALRVVVSDLPARFPREIEECLTAQNGTSNGQGSTTLAGCIDDLCKLIDDSALAITDQQVNAARENVKGFKRTIESVDDIPADFDGSIGILRIYGDSKKVTPILQLQSQLRKVREPLVELLGRPDIKASKALKDFAANVDKLKADPVAEEDNLLRQLPDVKLITDAFEQLVALVRKIDKAQLAELLAFFSAIDQLLQQIRARGARLESLKDCLLRAAAESDKRSKQPAPVRSEDIIKCLNERLGDKRLIPLDDQVSGRSLRILSKLIYNSVTTFIVGEKTMIQMPTWFFPAGAGPFSEDGGSVTHGFPAPDATFRFAEPVFVDTQQNFRVEMEIPDALALDELQRIYGPLFIWVALDGYMSRDVQ